jgi:XapX domain-containing protein
MKLVLLAVITGFAAGFLFAILKLPIPAPPALEGVMGIVGIYLGFKAFQYVSSWLQVLLK